MFKSLHNNHHVEKIQFLPDDFLLDVTMSWCTSVISILRYKEEDHGDLLYMMIMHVEATRQRYTGNSYHTEYVTMSVGNIMKIISVCGDCAFCCIFPYDYDKVAQQFVTDYLGVTKIQIDLLFSENKMNEIFELINMIEDNNVKRLALLYIKSIYSIQTEEMITKLKNSRTKVISEINSILYY